MPSLTSLFTLLSLTLAALAKTDLSGCTSSSTKDAYGSASMIYYVPGTGEVCEILDCGGGRAPPKTTVPGCAAYAGTSTYSPSYLSLAAATPTTTPSVIPSATSSTSTTAAITPSTTIISTTTPSISSMSSISSMAVVSASTVTSSLKSSTTGTTAVTKSGNTTLASTGMPSMSPVSVTTNDGLSQFPAQMLVIAIAALATFMLV